MTCDAAFTSLVRTIRNAGFVLALDDYVGDPSFDPILPFVTFVKIDFLALREDPARLDAVIATCKTAGKTILAEKVETEADITFCRSRDIPLAQGYFYSRPQVVTTKVLDANQTVKLNLLAEVSREEMDIPKIRDILGSDVSLTYKLLRYVNSADFYRGQTIESLDYAVRRLGRNALASWVCVNLLASLGSSAKERELAFTSAVRGRFLALADADRVAAPRHHQGQTVCLLGLLSLLDAMLGLPMAEALAGLTIDPGMGQALLGHPSPHLPCLTLCQKFEGLNAGQRDAAARAFGVAPEQATAAHFAALSWAAEMFRG